MVDRSFHGEYTAQGEARKGSTFFIKKMFFLLLQAKSGNRMGDIIY